MASTALGPGGRAASCSRDWHTFTFLHKNCSSCGVTSHAQVTTQCFDSQLSQQTTVGGLTATAAMSIIAQITRIDCLLVTLPFTAH